MGICIFSEASGASLNDLQEEGYKRNSDNHKYLYCVGENTKSLFARGLILSAHALIAFTLPSDTACSPTVPGGNTPCLTAGDARRANPWTDDSANLRRRRRRTTAHFCTSELSLHAFSATPPASECPLSTSPTGSPSLWLGYHPRLRMVRLRRRRYSVWMRMRALFCAAAAEPKAGVAILCLFLLIPILL